LTSKFPIAVRAIAYDLDGTLVDSVGDLAFAANLMRQELALEPIPESEIKTYIGKGIANLVRRAVMRGRDPGDDVSDAYVANALAICERYYTQVMCRTTQPYPRAIDGLKAALDKGLRLAVITNKATRFTERMLEELDLAKYFELTLSGDSLPKKKPDPEPLLHVGKVFGIDPSELLMIGDSENDIEAAHNAGCPSFFVPYGYFQGADIHELKPTAIVSDLVEAVNLIENSAFAKSTINL
jgi:phosphoglycolate phosphatase